MRLRGRGIVGTIRRGARHLTRLLVSHLKPYAPMPGGPDVLDGEYRDGRWDYLADEREVPRFHVVAGYCLRTARRPRVLEVGCGEGLLAERLTPHRYADFVGVDVALPAIERARARGLVSASFVAADAATFELPHGAMFDVVVFNETLEYFADPMTLVRRYERWLAPGGEFVISQYRATDDARTRKIWRLLHTAYVTKLRTTVSTGGLTWTIEALVPATVGRPR